MFDIKPKEKKKRSSLLFQVVLMTKVLGLEKWIMEAVGNSEGRNVSARNAVEINTPSHLHCFDPVRTEKDQEMK